MSEDAPGFHWFNQSWMARDYERVTGTCSFELRADPPTSSDRQRFTQLHFIKMKAVRELRCSFKHADSASVRAARAGNSPGTKPELATTSKADLRHRDPERATPRLGVTINRETRVTGNRFECPKKR